MPGVLRFEDFELDRSAYELRRAGRVIRLERIPLDLLFLLAERRGQLVTREEILQRIWGKDIFIDVDNSINTAVRKIRQALRDNPERPRYLHTIPAKGYRFAAPIVEPEQVPGRDTPPPAPSRGDVAGLARRARHRPPWAALAGVIAAAVLLVLSIAYSYLHHSGWVFSRAPTVPIRSLAVLPLENLSGDSQQEYFADGTTDELITQLAKISALRVISRTSVMRYKGTRKPLEEIARELNVDAVVEGTVVRSGERVRVTAQVVQVNPEKHLWADRYERPLGDIVVMQGELAREIAQAIRIKLTPQEQTRLANVRPVNHEAYEACLKGRYYWNKRTGEALKRAVDYFQQGIEKDPGYAPAYAGLADSYATLPLNTDTAPKQYFPKAKAAAIKALEIDDTIAEAHTSLAFILTTYDWDWSGAERQFKRAIELNPSYAAAHLWYGGQYLSAMGRHTEAIAEIRRAQELDPLSAMTNTLAGLCFFYAHRYDEALEQCRKAFEIDPAFSVAHLFSGRAYERKGMYREALAEAKEAGERVETLSLTAYTYAAQGMTEPAQQILEALISRSKQRYVPSWHIMKIYLALGQKDQAFAWLEKAFQEREGRMIWVNVDPMLDSLRSDPRFTELLHRLRLPP